MSLRIGLYIVAALFVVALFGKTYQAGKEHERAKLTAQYEKQLTEERARIKSAEDRANAITEAKDRERLTETRELQTRIDSLVAGPRVGVRLCEPVTRSAATPGVSEAAGDAHAAASGEGPDLRAGRDLEPELLQFAQRCETDRTAVIKWQAWIVAQAAAWINP